MTGREARALARTMTEVLGRTVYVTLATEDGEKYYLLQWCPGAANGINLIGAADCVRESHGAYYLDNGERIK